MYRPTPPGLGLQDVGDGWGFEYKFVNYPTLGQGVIVKSSVHYRRTGFKCEHVIIANCDFSLCAQLLERNV